MLSKLVPRVYSQTFISLMSMTGVAVKNALGITGIILILLVQQLLPQDDGMRAALLFLGGSLCSTAVFLNIYPFIDRMIAVSSKLYYMQIYEEQLNIQQERIRQMEEELMQNRKKR